MRHGSFDSDATALEQRIRSHEKFGSRDLNEWIFSILQAQPGHRVLDLGCGTGKQSVPLASQVGPDGGVVALDLSAQALEIVRARATEAGVGDRIATVCDSLDNAGERLGGAVFDRIIASYSIYYVEDPEKLFATVRDALAPRGIFFFCGPTRRNNAEIIDFHHRVSGTGRGSPGTADQFMEEDGPRLARDYFGAARIDHFENPVRFDSAEALYAYWSSYNLFDPDMAEDFREAAERHFAEHGFFETVKRVVGISVVGS